MYVPSPSRPVDSDTTGDDGVCKEHGGCYKDDKKEDRKLDWL